MLKTSLLLCIFWGGALSQVSSSPCPKFQDTCSCLVSDLTLSIECQHRTDVVDLLDQFARNHSQIQSISISGALLPRIPPAVCSLDQLRTLGVINSSLQELSPDCFNQMHQLTSLTVNLNPLTALHDGLFDNNPKLSELYLDSNEIETIGPKVFANETNLPSLWTISMRDNKLTEVNVWPLIRMLNHQTSISLRRNLIKNLTNTLGWRYNCDKGAIKGELDLKQNRIERFSYLEKYWLTSLQDAVCIFSKDKNTRLKIEDNPYHCDCEEYEWIKLFRVYWKKSGSVAQIVCHTPPNLVPGVVDPKVTIVHLEDVVCVKPCLGKLGKCTEQPHKRTFYVQSSKISDLPDSLPPTYWNFDTPYAYQLLFDHSQVRNLVARSYFNQTSLLDLSFSQLVNVDTFALHMLTHAQVKINNNHLITLPENITKVKFRGMLSLQDNPWVCECNKKWLQQYLRQLALNGSLEAPSAILCASPTWLENVKLLDADFCSSDPALKKRQMISLSVGSIVGSLVILFLSLLLIYKGRVWLFVHFHVRIFNEWDDSPDCTHDAFISFAWDDYDEAQRIVEQLEEEHGFRCCIHNRDFDPANRFMDQMGESIDRSRRTLCLLSPHFVQSEYCLWEFSYAFNEDVRRKKKRLAVIMLNPALEFNDDNQIVRQYINTFTYLNINDPDFTKKLLYVMPEEPVHGVDSDNQHRADMEHSQNDEMDTEGPTDRDRQPLLSDTP